LFLKPKNLIIVALFSSCVTLNTVQNVGNIYSDQEVLQFCEVKALVQHQQQDLDRGEDLILSILDQYQVSEERFQVIVRSQVLDSMIALSTNEQKMLKALENDTKNLSRKHVQDQKELIISNGMDPSLFYEMQQDYDRSTRFQHRVANICKHT